MIMSLNLNFLLKSFNLAAPFTGTTGAVTAGVDGKIYSLYQSCYSCKFMKCIME